MAGTDTTITTIITTTTTSSSPSLNHHARSRWSPWNPHPNP